MKKAILSIPDNSPFYTNLFFSIKQGFEEAGINVISKGGVLEPSELLILIELESPDFVFEMNRTKSEIPNFPDGLIHICWLVDFWGRRHQQIYGSDILYTFASDWVKHFPKKNAKKIAYLPPATNLSIYKPLNYTPKYDFSFFGHIPNPWNENELNRIVSYSSNNQPVLFHELLPDIHAHSIAKHVTESLYDALNSKYNIYLQNLTDTAMVYDISSRAVRQYRREKCVASCLKFSTSLEIFGTPNWKNYPLFKSYYKTFLEDPMAINHALQNAKVLLHDGNYPHFRTFDAMASGSVVAAAIPPKNFTKIDDGWEQLSFKENEDYLPVNFYHENQKLSLSIKNQTLMSDIAYNAREKVQNNHTWAHRAQIILNDLKGL